MAKRNGKQMEVKFCDHEKQLFWDAQSGNQKAMDTVRRHGLVARYAGWFALSKFSLKKANEACEAKDMDAMPTVEDQDAVTLAAIERVQALSDTTTMQDVVFEENPLTDGKPITNVQARLEALNKRILNLQCQYVTDMGASAPNGVPNQEAAAKTQAELSAAHAELRAVYWMLQDTVNQCGRRIIREKALTPSELDSVTVACKMDASGSLVRN